MLPAIALAAILSVPTIDGVIEDWWRTQAPTYETEHYSVWEKSESGKRWVAVRSDRPTPVLIIVADTATMRLQLVSSTAAEAEYRYSAKDGWLIRKYEYFVDNDELRGKFNRGADKKREWQASHGTQGQPGEYEAFVLANPEDTVFVVFYTLGDGLVSMPRSPVDTSTLESWIRGATPERIQLR